ncbi:MAG TPA: zf-HC2 domain-containing protein [Thermoanaerobaculia bacterium]|nr:zf-HC2 domain-containing protein [Thermoanaerobaculia bacterium]
MGAMLTCRELLDFLDDYRQDRLTAAERTRFEQHLAVCADCVAYLESYERSLELTRRALRAPDDEVPAEVPADLVTAILASRRAR